MDSSDKRSEPPSGRHANVPHEIPARGWLEIFKRVGREFGRNETTITAAGISFFALFALFPAIAAFVAFYGLFANPQTVVDNMQAITGFVPADVVATLLEQMLDLAGRSKTALVAAGTFSLVVSLWSAQQGVAALLIALNAAYRENMPHGPLRHLLRSLYTAVSVITGLTLIATLAIGLPLVVEALGGNFWTVTLVRVASMALGGLCLLFGLAGLYRWVPHRRPPQWRWVGAGAAVVVAFWTVSSILFSVFLAYSGTYTAMYGSLSAVVILLTLTYVTVITVLVGAELNAQMEYHTTRDTTVAEPRPMGKRGAYVADHVAEDGRAVDDNE